MLGVALATMGLSYAAVPLYRMFCQATGFGGTVKKHSGGEDDEGYNLPEDPSSAREPPAGASLSGRPSRAEA